jgi:hypothetical protein
VGNSDPDCHWVVSPGFCEGDYTLNCVGNDVENPTNCNQDSIDIGCVWKKISNSGCATDFYFNCEGNNEENPTACNLESMAAGCKWIDAQEGCRSKYHGLQCSLNQEGECTNVGCKLRNNHGYCTGYYNGGWMNCETKEDNSGCTDNSDKDCVYYGYSSAECVLKNSLNCWPDPCKPGCSDEADSRCLWQGSAAKSRLCVVRSDNWLVQTR